jgi:adenine-specific DNA-methyltransferase
MSIKKIFDELQSLLSKDNRFVSDGNLLKNKITEYALKLDDTLITLLLKNNKLKETFFKQINTGIIIFNTHKFNQFVNNKNFLQNSYTTFLNEIRLGVNKDYLAKSGEVVLLWPYKDCILEGDQEKESDKRNEVFHNEILAPDEIDRLLQPKVMTSFIKRESDGEKKISEIKTTDNLIIKGNNLLVLHSLKRKYRNKVKLIYIDPPYNTGNDEFNYNDDYTHSTWLTFMKNRLEIAKELLKNDGMIFIQINDIEQAYLKVLCDEIFGKDHFQTTICIKMSHKSGVKMSHKEVKLPKIKEYILFYSKSKEIKLNPQYIPVSWEDSLDRYTSFIKKNGFPDEECEKWERITLKEAINEFGIDYNNKKAVLNFKLENADLIFRTARNRGMDYSSYPKAEFSRIVKSDDSYYFIYNHEDVIFADNKVREINGCLTPVEIVGDIWTDIGINNLSKEGGVDLRYGKKPEKLIERILLLCTQEGDLVMDFFAGSGTTSATAHKMRRQYIVVEQLQEHIDLLRLRMINVINGEKSGISRNVDWKGGGDFVYFELKEFNENFITKIKNATEPNQIIDIWAEMKKHAFLNYLVDVELLDQQIQEFKKLTLDEQKKVLMKCLDLNNLYVNYSEIEDAMYEITDGDKELNKLFYEGI